LRGGGGVRETEAASALSAAVAGKSFGRTANLAENLAAEAASFLSYAAEDDFPKTIRRYFERPTVQETEAAPALTAAVAGKSLVPTANSAAKLAVKAASFFS
jgi:hypothetical protein